MMNEDNQKLHLSHHRLRDILNNYFKKEDISYDLEVENFLSDLSEEFLGSLVNYSCKLAKHRQGDNISAQDIILACSQLYQLSIPTPPIDMSNPNYSNITNIFETPLIEKSNVNTSHLEKLKEVQKTRYFLQKEAEFEKAEEMALSTIKPTKSIRKRKKNQ